jgi:hypothetical protein
MGDINASVPQQQLPNYIGTAVDAAQVEPRNALLRSQAASTDQDTQQKRYVFAANAIGSALYPVTIAPPDQRQAAYEQAKAQLKTAGVDISGMPAQVDRNFINSALSRAIGIMDTYKAQMQPKMVDALSGGSVQAPSLLMQSDQPPATPPGAAPLPPPVPGAAATSPAAAPAGAPAPMPANALNAPPPRTGGIPGAGPGMALSYLIDPSKAAQEISDQMQPQNIRPGSVYLNPATGVQFQVPELPDGVSYNPDTGVASPTPGAAAAAADFKRQTELGGKRGELGGEYEGTVRADAAGSVQHVALLNQMRQELSGITNFDPGTYGTLKGKASKLFASVLGDNDSATNFQEFQKNSIQLALAQAKSMSPREAFQGVLFVQSGNPNFDMTRDGIEGVIGQMQGLDQYKIAKSQALSNWAGDPNKFETYWQKQTDPTVFMFNNASPAQKQQMLGALSKAQKIQFLQVYRNTRDSGWLPAPPQ